ncbi:fatty-acid-binding protein 1 [Nymphaea colorata]|nr:fatty-acid-binding protein 1 [Nymphaea colorata]XP_031488408.1 fatty-acid-binding protein 1 [Nymphaea colorata]
MVSLRFPFSFHGPNKLFTRSGSSSSYPSPSLAFSVGVVFGLGAGLAISTTAGRLGDHLLPIRNLFDASSRQLSPLWGSLSLTTGIANLENSVVDSRTGAEFPPVLDGSRKLLGIGLRRKNIIGIKNINVYAFGVYVDDSSIKQVLSEKYGSTQSSELEGKERLCTDVLENDLCVTVRLSIVYGRLSIRSVRNAFEESVGNRLRKFSGDENRELLQRFTSQFKDELKLSRGTIIDLSREKGHVLRTKVDGKEVGCIQSQLLCRSIFDLYIGEDPFDKQAKDDIQRSLASLLEG